MPSRAVPRGLSGGGLENRMSDTAALGLILASFGVCSFLFQYIITMLNRTAVEIETGVVRGMPVSNRYRRIMFESTWTAYGTSATTVAVFGAIFNIKVAGCTSEGGIQAVAYIAAAICAVAALGCVASNIPEFIHYRSTLRQAEGKP